MLLLHTSGGQTSEAAGDLHRAALPPDVVWIDLLQPSAAEVAFVERTTKLRLPTLDELSEIESSSRLRAEDGLLYMSAPLVHRAITNEPRTTPVGFVLAPERLVTVRFETLAAFSAFEKVAR